MKEPSNLYDYIGTCLACGKSWTLTREQLEVIVKTDSIAYSTCCSEPATIVKRRAKHDHKKNH